MSTTIEWTDETWNPVVGCSVASPGCDNCYAASVASRQMQPAHKGLTVGRQWNGEVRLLPERINEPIKWRKARRVFVCSMSDLFHPSVPDDFISGVFQVMDLAATRQHTFQILTKRPQRMNRLLNKWGHLGFVAPDNVWLGTSIESDDYTWRTKSLLNTPAAVRFVSLEPLLGPLPSLDFTGIDWVIVGGESGPGCRPMAPNWVRDLRDRATAAGAAFFFKQWGGRTAKANGRELDGRTWDEYPVAL